MSNSSYKDKIVNRIKDFLDHDEWHYFFDEEDSYFDFGLRIEGKLSKLQYMIDVGETNFVVYVFCPLSADPDNLPRLVEIAEFFTRLNYGMRNGNFELDMNEGEIRFKVFVDCEDALPSDAIIRNSLYYPSACFDVYGSAIIDMVIGDKSVEDALARFQNPELPDLSDLDPDDLGAIEKAFSQLFGEQALDEDDYDDENEDENDPHSFL